MYPFPSKDHSKDGGGARGKASKGPGWHHWAANPAHPTARATSGLQVTQANKFPKCLPQDESDSTSLSSEAAWLMQKVESKLRSVWWSSTYSSQECSSLRVCLPGYKVLKGFQLNSCTGPQVRLGLNPSSATGYLYDRGQVSSLLYSYCLIWKMGIVLVLAAKHVWRLKYISTQ